MKKELNIINKKVNFEYEILESIEAGIVLIGAEVKGIVNNNISLKESYVKIINGEVFLIGAHISIPTYANPFSNIEETRDRKLLLHKREINKLQEKAQENGLTLVARKIYTNNGKIKVEVCLVRGKKLYDKRETLKRKQQDMDAKRALKDY